MDNIDTYKSTIQRLKFLDKFTLYKGVQREAKELEKISLSKWEEYAHLVMDIFKCNP